MFAAMRWLLIPALLAGWLLPAGPARASRAAAPSPAGVRDEAGMFPEEAKKKADQKVQQIKEYYGVGLLIETVPSIPEADKAKYEELGKEKFFLRWAEFRAKRSGVRGIYVLICKKPGRVEVVANETLREKGFTTSVRDDLAQKLAAGFREKKPGEGLLAAVDYADAKLKTIVGKRSTAAGGASAPVGGSGRQSPPPEEKRGFFSGLWGWICIGLVAVMVLWLVFGLIRAFTGAGRPAGYGGGPGGPGGGYGGGGYGGGGGGGGGGFLTSLLGGMFGAAAGSWMYDSFFRGSHGGGGGWSQAQAGAPPTAAPTPGGGDADYGGNTGGGADFGDNDGGGGGGTGADFGDDGGGGTGADFGDDGGGGTGADFGDDGGGGADFGGGGDDGGGADF